MELDIIEAIVLGTLFGFTLYKIGAGDPDKLMGMLKLQDLHLAKTILGGIGFATIILFTGVLLGLVPMEHFSIKGIYWGVIFGAIIFVFYLLDTSYLIDYVKIKILKEKL